MERRESESCFDGFEEEEEDGYDAIVVGSGYGGSVAACRLSMAGLKVCLAEKGRKWEAHDFPTDSLKILSAVRMENRDLGVSFGPKDALFQVYEQDECLAAVACGLGGGSLVNAGVMVPTPIRARRNPKWPKDWERDWEICEASASTMLRIQSVPIKFPNSKVMEIITGDEFEEHKSLNLSINFDVEDKSLLNSSQSLEIGSCLACGNCLSGCPYNAKNSTDKNYLVSAVEAGCIVKTECQVQYVVKNPDHIFKEQRIRRKGSRSRRWLVFLNEIDYIACDFVILSAGVLGTANILFQSQIRGLKLSENLGNGFSCNGNHVAYVAGSPAPLKAFGLDKKQFSKKPFKERPGPSISSSFTSSLGFTVQSAVLPTSYPYLLFKGITTYGWPCGYWFLHGVIDKLKHTLGFKATQAMVLNVMGYDENNGKITLDKDTNKISFTPPRDPLLSRKIEAFQKLTKKLGGILFMSKYRSTSVHLLGGCNASLDHLSGVCNPNGQVFDTKSLSTVHDGLYVCDASLIPCSIGINPCLTIATASEHVSRHLVRDVLKYKDEKGIVLVDENNFSLNRGSFTSRKSNKSLRSTVVFKETMRGYIGGMPCTAYLKMKMNSKSNEISGKSDPLLRGRVGGCVEFKAMEIDKLHVIDGEVDLCKVDNKTPYTQYMQYRLLLATSSGSRYILEGRKTINPFLFALYGWRETTLMYVTFKNVSMDNEDKEMVNLKGELNISIIELLKTLMTLQGNLRGKFIYLLLQSFFRTYVLQVPRESLKDYTPSIFYERPYPKSTLHEIKTEDGFIISCRQWKCNQNPFRVEGEKRLKPVLLLNGHTTESYWLPTEPNDLVRTLLEQGHEIWLLQPRLHHLNSSNNFTIEDIGRFDIPAVIDNICELHGASIKIHVVAHCVGGLAIHIALLGGHVSANHIASLSCTNSSMFFKLTTSSRFKMWLPLIPISMFILGENRTLPLFRTLKASSRHRILKFIARFIPRYERCTCEECEIFSGIFGNTFWHENISPTMHYWLNKESLPRLPMAAFPHLRRICNSGYIVDRNGENSYLIHPERMSLPTLYISGGRTLLVTPETSFLANKYMRLHQPSFRHERVVLEGFGHSDLLIGEESYKKVFPHILNHIRLAEEGRNAWGNMEGRKFSEEELAWGEDLYEEGLKGLGRWISPLVTICLCLLLLIIIVSLFF